MKIPSLKLIPSALWFDARNSTVLCCSRVRAGFWSASELFSMLRDYIFFLIYYQLYWTSQNWKDWLQYKQYSSSWGLFLSFPCHVGIFGWDMVTVKLQSDFGALPDLPSCFLKINYNSFSKSRHWMQPTCSPSLAWAGMGSRWAQLSVWLWDRTPTPTPSSCKAGPSHKLPWLRWLALCHLPWMSQWHRQSCITPPLEVCN